MTAFKKYRDHLRRKRVSVLNYESEEENAAQYVKYTAYLLKEYKELQKAFPEALTARAPQDKTLNQYLLNVQNGIDALQKSSLPLRNRVLSLLLSFIVEGTLWNAPVYCIRDERYQIGPYIRKLEEAITEFQEFTGPLSKVVDIIRSYKAKPYSRVELAETAYIDTLPEVAEAINELTALYLELHSLPSSKSEVIHTNMTRLMRASVLHAPQFSILPYYLTVMFLQKRDVFEQPASVDWNDTTLYHLKVNLTALRGVPQEKYVNVYLQIQEIIVKHTETNVATYKTLQTLSPKERLTAMLATQSTIFAAANTMYAPTSKVAAKAAELCSTPEDRIPWLEDQWEKLYYYRDLHGNAINKKEAINQCISCEEGKILTALKTVIQPKNRIRLLAHQELDAESRQALQRLYGAILQENKVSCMDPPEATEAKMFARVGKFFELQQQDISLLLLRMKCESILIDETEIDPFEETILESFHNSLYKILNSYRQCSHLEESWSYHITSEVRLEFLPLQEFLLKLKWNRDYVISFCNHVDVRKGEFFSIFSAFIQEIDTKNKLNSFWKNLKERQDLVQKHILREAFQIVLLKIEEYLVKQIMTTIWECICKRGGFLYIKENELPLHPRYKHL